MRMFVFVFVVVAIVLFAGAVPAEAQYYNPDPNPVQSLIQGNLNLVHGSRMYGYGGGGGGGYYQPQYYDYGNQSYYQPQQQRRPLNTLERSILGGAIGALGTRTITKNGYAIAGVALGGILVGALTGRNQNQNQQQQYQYQPQYPQGQGRGQLVPAPMPEQEPAPNLGAEPWPEQNQTEPAIPNVQMKNCTRVRGELYDWDSPVGTLQPGESRQFPVATRGGYRGLATIGIVRSWTDSRYQDSTGSILFIEPTGGAR